MAKKVTKQAYFASSVILSNQSREFLNSWSQGSLEKQKFTLEDLSRYALWWYSQYSRSHFS